jgi:hypothetical protein
MRALNTVSVYYMCAENSDRAQVGMVAILGEVGGQDKLLFDALCRSVNGENEWCCRNGYKRSSHTV